MGGSNVAVTFVCEALLYFRPLHVVELGDVPWLLGIIIMSLMWELSGLSFMSLDNIVQWT